MSEPQAHHCVTCTITVNLARVQCEHHTDNKLLL